MSDIIFLLLVLVGVVVVVVVVPTTTTPAAAASAAAPPPPPPPPPAAAAAALATPFNDDCNICYWCSHLFATRESTPQRQLLVPVLNTSSSGMENGFMGPKVSCAEQDAGVSFTKIGVPFFWGVP